MGKQKESLIDKLWDYYIIPTIVFVCAIVDIVIFFILISII